MGRGPRYSETEARAAVASSYSWSEALRALGMCPTGGGASTLKKYAALWSISTAHFDPNVGKHRCNVARRARLESILVRGSTFSRGTLKKRLYEAGLKSRECEMCGQGELWHGRRMSLILDHINGVRDDHRIENLRIVCPNCATTLSTHCGRNVRRQRTCEHCDGLFEPGRREHRYCSIECANREAGLGVPRPSSRKVERPPLAQLERDLEEMSFCAVGRKYGVSDNAVRKWLVWYERQREREQAAA